MSINEKINEAYKNKDATALVEILREATQLYSEYSSNFAKYERWYDKSRAKNFIELAEKKSELNLTDKLLEAKAKLLAEEERWNYREYRENKSSMSKTLEAINSLIIELRTKEKHLSRIN